MYWHVACVLAENSFAKFVHDSFPNPVPPPWPNVFTRGLQSVSRPPLPAAEHDAFALILYTYICYNNNVKI